MVAMKNAAKFMARHLPHFSLAIFILTVTAGTFNGGVWAALGIGFALVMFICVWWIEKRISRPDQQLLLLILLMLAICAALNLQSSQPKMSWSKWEELITIFLPLSLLTAPLIQKHARSPRLFALLPWLTMVSVVAFGFELALNEPLFIFLNGKAGALTRYNRGFSYLVILAFPLMAGLMISKRRWMIVPFLLMLFFPASLTESRAAKLALVLGLLTVLAARFLPLLTRRLLFAVPILSIGWPFAVQKIFLEHRAFVEHLPHSWEDRVEIWDYMSYRIFDRPWLGWGLGSSPMLSFKEPNGALYHVRLTDNAPHAHNALLQLWVELGLPGLILGITFALLVLHRISRLKPALIPFAAGAWVAAFCLAMIAYDVWSDSLWAAFALTGFAFALLQKQAGVQQS